MKNSPLILLVNDDGIESPGLHAVIEALTPVAELVVAAPASQQSATGRSLRVNPGDKFSPRKISLNSTTAIGWSLDASPAVVLHLAIQCLTNGRIPDMVVSGINYGENIGSDVTISGTVGAAIQAAVWDIKAVAVSMEVPHELHFQYGEVDWSAATTILQRAVPRLLKAAWPPDVDIIKIDIPKHADGVTPWRVCRQSREPGWWGLIPNAHPESEAGDDEVHRGPRTGHTWGLEDDGAVLLNERCIAITPLSIDMTSRVPLPEIQKLMD